MISKRTYHITTSLKLDEWGAMFLFINCEQSSQAQSLKEAISKGQASKPWFKSLLATKAICHKRKGPSTSFRSAFNQHQASKYSINIQIEFEEYKYSIYIHDSNSTSTLISSWCSNAQSQIISCFSKYEHWPTMGYIIWDNFLSRSNTLLLLMVEISVLFSISLQSIHENW